MSARTERLSRDGWSPLHEDARRLAAAAGATSRWRGWLAFALLLLLVLTLGLAAAAHPDLDGGAPTTPLDGWGD